MSRSRLMLLAGAAVMVGGLATAPAHAGGFLADTFVRPFSPSAARQLDRAHAQMGRPLDHAANRAAGWGVGAATGNPAAGAATTRFLETRDYIRRGGR